MKYVLFLIFLVSSFFVVGSAFAIECGDTPPSGNLSELKSYIDSCNQKIASNRDQQSTLKTVITTINSKINLAQAQINQTQTQIAGLEKDIQVLSGVLETVNISMDQLTSIYIARVRESYRRSRVSQMDILFTSGSLSEFLHNMKFITTIKTKDQLILSELERSRLDYNQKKTDKITKQKEIEKLKTKLISQKKDLDNQQLEKQKILVTTQNDEKKFQSLLKQAKEEVLALSRYVTSQGGATLLSNQTKCDDWGCYYSQRDAEWGNKLIGNSDMTLKEVGCLITSTAMVASHYKKDIKPVDVAASSNPFFADTAYMVKGSWNVNGVTVERTEISGIDKMDDELKSGNPVIVGLFRGPAHFIVIRSKTDSGYIMYDPFMENGGNRPFSDKYTVADITQINSVRVH